jgi:steroid delta-isomerase-like uncharacterized protein
VSAREPTSPVAVVTAYLDALNDHDPDEASHWVADDFFNEHVSVRGTSFRGRREYRRRVEAFLGEMADLHYDVERMVATGATVVVAYRMSAQWAHEGGRRPFAIRGVFWFEVLGGRIAHRVDYRDGVDFEQQVGLR